MSTSRRAPIVIVMLLLLAMLSGCSTGGDSDKPAAVTSTAGPTQASSGTLTPDGNGGATGTASIKVQPAVQCESYADDKGFLKADDFEKSLSCVVEAFTWPDGMKPDDAFLAKVKAGMPGGGNGRYEQGLEWGFAGGFNSCAWQITWLQARQDGDTVLESKALDYMTSVVPNFETVIPGFPAGSRDGSVIAHTKDLAGKAGLGDAGTIQEWVIHNCGTYDLTGIS